MTRRDAFVLGVATHCKLAELDSDDTIALVDLLLSDPGAGAAIVKRAKADPVLLLKAADMRKAASITLGGVAAYLAAQAAITAGAWAINKYLLDGGDKEVLAQAARTTPMPDFSQEQLKYMREQHGFDPTAAAQPQAEQAAGRYPGSAWGGGGGQWGGGSWQIPPAFTRTMSPGGAPAAGPVSTRPMLNTYPADARRARAADERSRHGFTEEQQRDPKYNDWLRARMDLESGTSTDASDRPYATQAPYLAGLTGLTDKDYATGVDWANQRMLANKALRRQLRQLNLSYGHAVNMTPEQMATAEYSPQVIALIGAAKKYRLQQQAATGGRSHTAYGTGFGPSGTAAVSPITTAAATLPQPTADSEYEKARARMRQAESQLDMQSGAAQPYAAQTAAAESPLDKAVAGQDARLRGAYPATTQIQGRPTEAMGAAQPHAAQAAAATMSRSSRPAGVPPRQQMTFEQLMAEYKQKTQPGLERWKRENPAPKLPQWQGARSATGAAAQPPSIQEMGAVAGAGAMPQPSGQTATPGMPVAGARIAPRPAPALAPLPTTAASASSAVPPGAGRQIRQRIPTVGSQG